MIKYRVKLEDDEGTVLVTAPDFPGVITFGDTREQALEYAVGAFREMIAGKIHYSEPIPKPSRVKAGEPFIVLPLQTEMKIRLYESLQENGMKKAELARRMKLHRQEIDRLLDFKQSTSIGKIESAFAALGKQLKIEVADAS
ncbi:MAG: type II toxin-antitoxin system HicB family antitoxin [Aestuariivirga sp.]